MANEIQLLSEINKGTTANNELLSDIAEFTEIIKDKVLEYLDVFSGTADVHNTANATSQNINNTTGNGDLDSIVNAINNIISNASKYKGGGKGVGDMISGIGKGIRDFAHVLKDGGTSLRTNKESLNAIVESINYLAENIQAYEGIDLKRKTVFLFSSIGTAVSAFSDNLWGAALKLKTGKMAIRWIVEGIDYMLQKLSNSKALFTTVDSGMGQKTAFEVIMNSLGDNIYKFSQHLWSTAIKLRTGRIAITWIVEAIDKIAQSLTKSEKGLTNIGLLSNVGISVFKFASLVALSAPMLLIAIPSLLLLAGALALFNFAMKFFDEGLLKSAQVLQKIGLSVLLFSGSLVLSALLMSTIANGPGMIGLAILFGSMAVLGLIFYMFGETFSTMGKGALGIALISLALPLFAFSIALSAAMISDVGVLNVIGLLAAVAGAALVFGLAGVFAMEIALGALAIAMIGGSLWVLGWGMENMLQMMDNTNIWQLLGTAGLIAGLGLIYAGAGVAFPLIAAGAIAIGLIALSMWGIGKAIQSVMSIDLTEDKLDAFAGAIPKFMDAFTSIGLVDMLTIPLRLPAILAMGLGIAALAAGVMAWSKIDISDRDVQEIANKITSVLTVLPNVFATIGRADRGENSSRSIFGVLFGADFSKGDVERGIDSTMKLGSNLKNLADGIMAWKNMKITPADIQTIQANVASVLSAIPQIFAEVGKADKEGGSSSLLKMLVGADFEKGNVEAGIKSTKDLGKTLADLATGIKAWATGGKEAISPADIQLASKNIAAVLAVLPQSFADIGKQDKDSEGWFSDGDIETGIDLIKKLSPILKSVSDFILSFKSIDIIGTSVQIGFGVKYIFSSLAEVMKSFEDKEDSMDKMDDFFGTLVKNFGKFGDNVSKSVKFLKEFVSYVDPMLKLAGAFERITFSIERQVKSINTISTPNFTAYSGMIGSLMNLSKANLAVVESNMSYSLGSGRDYSTPYYGDSIFTNPGRPTAPYTPAITGPGPVRKTVTKSSTDKEILGEILTAIRENGAQVPIDGQTLGTQIAQAIISYFNQQNFKFK